MGEGAASAVRGFSFAAAAEEQLELFWKRQMDEVQNLSIGEREGFKNHNDLPLARIKRIMKADDDVRMIRAEAPVLFAKACELFILELTLRAFSFSESDRRNLCKEDIYTAVQNTDVFDFLEDILREKEEALRAAAGR
jgi:histone H3/H4